MTLSPHDRRTLMITKSDPWGCWERKICREVMSSNLWRHRSEHSLLLYKCHTDKCLSQQSSLLICYISNHFHFNASRGIRIKGFYSKKRFNHKMFSPKQTWWVMFFFFAQVWVWRMDGHMMVNWDPFCLLPAKTGNIPPAHARKNKIHSRLISFKLLGANANKLSDR